MRPIQAIAVMLISAGSVVAAKWGLERMVTERLSAEGPSGLRAGDWRFANYWFGVGRVSDGPVDLVDAASMAVPATVHVTAKWHARKGEAARSLFDYFFDPGPEASADDSDKRPLLEMITGSGAILSNDGYIVTNNHVLDGADEVLVRLNNRKTLKAKIVGSDPTTDLAVLKIDAANLPFLLYGNSDEVKVGQWVVAVGYPLGLQVTATAGIVSGKGRSIDGKGRENYLQTDAAVNLGNSGGPLVNPAGQIVGINSAIASPNGAYTGYSFAVPVNTVRRVVNEIIKYGGVKQVPR